MTVPSSPTLADALLTLAPGELTWPVVSSLVDGVVPVSEDSILSAAKLLLMEGKILAEFSSAVGIAAVRDGLIPVSADEKVVFVISGGSIGLDQIALLGE